MDVVRRESEVQNSRTGQIGASRNSDQTRVVLEQASGVREENDRLLLLVRDVQASNDSLRMKLKEAERFQVSPPQYPVPH